jgi:glycerol uptake facilitator-like aquaporin
MPDVCGVLCVTGHGPASDLSRRCASEAIGTAFLLAAIVGSGIMAQSLTSDEALALLVNSVATGGALVALIAAFGPVSGAHFNPAITLSAACTGDLAWRNVPAYVGAQLIGALAGVGAANAMFARPVFFASHHVRHGPELLLAEAVATFGLLAVAWGCTRLRPEAAPLAIGAYITSAYWFTSSTSFANPAVTIARAFSDTFAGIRPADTWAFVLAQLLGAMFATALFAWLAPRASMAVHDRQVTEEGAAHG